MKFAVVGCGAVGSYYGAKLARAGQEVHFLLRSDYEAVRRNGVLIQSVEGDFRVMPHCASRPESIGPADVVLIGLKSTANGRFRDLLPPLVSETTALVTLQNGLGNEEDLARVFPVRQILGGLCFVCLNRVSPGVIRHMGYGKVVLGEFQRPPEARTHEIGACFTVAGVPCAISQDLARAHWEKLVWNIPFNGLGVSSAAGDHLLRRVRLRPEPRSPSSLVRVVAPCLTTDRLLGDADWARLVRELMIEVITAARALGFEISEAFADQLIDRTRAMGAYKASTLIDFERGMPLELESLFLRPLRQATQAGAVLPRLSALCQMLGELTRADPAGPVVRLKSDAYRDQARSGSQPKKAPGSRQAPPQIA